VRGVKFEIIETDCIFGAGVLVTITCLPMLLATFLIAGVLLPGGGERSLGLLAPLGLMCLLFCGVRAAREALVFCRLGLGLGTLASGEAPTTSLIS